MVKNSTNINKTKESFNIINDGITDWHLNRNTLQSWEITKHSLYLQI